MRIFTLHTMAFKNNKTNNDRDICTDISNYVCMNGQTWMWSKCNKRVPRTIQKWRLICLHFMLIFSAFYCLKWGDIHMLILTTYRSHLRTYWRHTICLNSLLFENYIHCVNNIEMECWPSDSTFQLKFVLLYMQT